MILLPDGALAQVPSAQCSAAYHEALEPVRTGRGATLANLHRALRAQDAELPGRWQFAHQLFSKVKAQPATKPERVCVEEKTVNGRWRCVRFETKAARPPPLEISLKQLPHTPDELRLMRLVNDAVEARGALPDVGNNGKFNFLVQRIAQDLRTYAGQPAHPALCSGSADLLEFYSNQLAPVKRRMDEVGMAAKQLKDAAAVRVRNIAVVEMKLYEKAAAEATTAAQAAAKVAVEAEAKAAATAAQASAVMASGAGPDRPLASATGAAVEAPRKSLPPKPADPAQLADYAVTSLSAQIIEALRPMLPAAAIGTLIGEPTPLAFLQKARLMLLDPATASADVPLEIADAALMSLRLLEARVYAEQYARRYIELDASLFGALADVRSAQAKSCTCRD